MDRVQKQFVFNLISYITQRIMSHHRSITGLTSQQVEQSRTKHGSNQLSPPARKPLWKLFIEKFNDPIIRILLIAAFLSLGIAFIHREYVETIGIFCAIFLSVGVGFGFEYSASKKFDLLNQVNQDIPYRTLRNGIIEKVAKKDLVVGDLVYVETGEEVPADGVLLEATALQVDESNLTGEPSVSKTTDPLHFDQEATYASNKLMRGAKILDGHALMQIEQVGDCTEYGKVAYQSSIVTEQQTPLNIQLDKLAKCIGLVGLVVSVLAFMLLIARDIFIHNILHTTAQAYTFVIGLLFVIVLSTRVWLSIVYEGVSTLMPRHSFGRMEIAVSKSWTYWGIVALVFASVCFLLGWIILGVTPFDASSWLGIDAAGRVLQHFMIAVTLIVVAVPEGLPMSVTLSLALSMTRMLKTNNLVRRMHACETMGAITVICTDKTGTLTQNKMQVAQSVLFAFTEGQDISAQHGKIVENLCANTTAHLEYDSSGVPSPLGNPTEGALLLWLHSHGISYEKRREDLLVVEQLTFSTERKYMATVVQHPQTNQHILLVKGAPEIILSRSASIIRADGEVAALTEAEKQAIQKQLLDFQRRAMRTLACAYYILPEHDKQHSCFVEGHLKDLPLVLDALFAIADPIREDVPQAVSECQRAGISVKMVTGDTMGTAQEIGRQVGIISQNPLPDEIITGAEFASLSDDEALKRCQAIKIMCRARPTDKQRLVQLLQRRGEVVAVTGDGTNDGPALNHADVGLSMGSGTDVAKEASDITLLDDSFGSIATAVMWGRSLYRNIQRFVYFQLTINVVALTLVLCGLFVGKELPLTITQMLWINLIMDTFAAAALATLPPAREVMKDLPRKMHEFIISKNMFGGIMSTSTIFVVALLLLMLYWQDENGEMSRIALTQLFTVFVMLQFWNLFNAKALYTKASSFSGLTKSYSFVLVSMLILLGQYVIVTFGGDVFRTTPLSWAVWIETTLYTSIVLWIGEGIRAWERSRLQV